MKKIWILLLLLLSLACLFVACDEDNTPNEDSTPAHTHVWGEWSVTVTPTCTTEGSHRRVCSGCPASEIEVIPAAHTYDAENTCTRCLDYKDKGVVFTLQGNTYTVTDYTGDATEVIIPSKYKGVALTSIGSSAFEGCSGLTSITIGNAVTSIDSSAFLGCSGLESSVVASGNAKYHSAGNCVIETESQTLVLGCKNSVIPTDGSVTSIGSDAFRGCSGLTSITIPDSVTSIGNRAFYNCSGLTSVIIGNGVKSIGSGVFYGCSGIIQKENGVSYVDKWVIDCDTSVMSVTLRANTVGIGYEAFYNCRGLTSITIPNSVKSIGSYAFDDCSGLTSITIGSGVTSIGSGAFSGCSGLTSITILESVTSIGDGAFKYCSGLTSITIPNSVESLGRYAFANCTNLSELTIGNSVRDIGSYAFEYCWGLTSITISDSVTSIGSGAFFDCSSLTSITIPNSVTSIGDGAFSNCSGLTSITIPNSVTSIGDGAFYRCRGLTSINYRGTEEQWNAITKGSYWNNNTGNYTITYNYTGE